MPPPIRTSEAGPSKRVAHFPSDSEDDEPQSRILSPLVKRQKLPNGTGTGTSKANGIKRVNVNGNGEKDKTLRKIKKVNGVVKAQNQNGGMRDKQRKERAEALLQTRQSLPFYQGMFDPSLLDITGRNGQS